MRNVSDKICRENQNTYFLFNNFFIFENHSVYETMWKNILEPGRSQMTIRRMRITCWIQTPSEYVILTVLLMQNACKNVLQCYVTCTLPVLLNVKRLCKIVNTANKRIIQQPAECKARYRTSCTERTA
jgi:6-phosphogluconolactonase/glucosamine-6-phosphate isomerase/deaminase